MRTMTSRSPVARVVLLREDDLIAVEAGLVARAEHRLMVPLRWVSDLYIICWQSPIGRFDRRG